MDASAGRPAVPPPSLRLYPIADADALGLANLPAAVEELATEGAEWIQLRIKQASDGERFRTVEACCRRLEGSATQLWVDDRVDLAALLPVAGVHLGQTDLPPKAGRRVLPSGRWIGFSTHNLRQVEQADADPAVDVVAVGPVFMTRSKERPDPVVGLELLRQARGMTRKPLVAIGGITAETLPEVLQTGVDAVAVIGALGRRTVGSQFRHLVRRLVDVSVQRSEEAP